MAAPPVSVTALADLDLTTVRAGIGPTSFARGRGYADAKRVLSVVWDGGAQALTGTVLGSDARLQDDHVAVAQELEAAHRSATGAAHRYHYHYGGVK